MTPRSWFKLVIVATVGALGIRGCVVEDFRIESNSMLPTLWPGDFVIANKAAFGAHLPFSNYEMLRWGIPRRGDVVLFSLPDKNDHLFTKRVIGLPGDQIRIRDGELFRNGERAVYNAGPSQLSSEGEILEERWADGGHYLILKKGGLTDFGPIDVPPNHLFLLGDNRSDSIDSRAWGPVPMVYLKGRLAWTLFSLDMYGGVRQGRSGLPL